MYYHHIWEHNAVFGNYLLTIRTTKKGMNLETNSAYPYQLQVKVFCNEFYCRGIKVSGYSKKDLIRSYVAILIK